METITFDKEIFLDVAFECLKKSGFKYTDSEVESLAEGLAMRASEWFVDCLHLEKK